MTPASTQILDKIHERLSYISIANGYSSDVVSLKRSKRTKFTASQIPAINYYSLDDVITKEFGAENHKLFVSIEWLDKTMDEPFNDLSAKRAADIIKALHEESGVISTFLGGLVDTVNIRAITPIIDQKNIPNCGVAVDIEVLFKTENFNHYTIL